MTQTATVVNRWQSIIRESGVECAFTQWMEDWLEAEEPRNTFNEVICFIARVWNVPPQHITLIRTQGVYRVRGLDKVYPLHMVLREHLGN